MKELFRKLDDIQAYTCDYDQYRHYTEEWVNFLEKPENKELADVELPSVASGDERPLVYEAGYYADEPQGIGLKRDMILILEFFSNLAPLNDLLVQILKERGRLENLAEKDTKSEIEEIRAILNKMEEKK